MFVGTVVCLDPRELKERPNEIVFGKGCFNNFLHEWPSVKKDLTHPNPKIKQQRRLVDRDRRPSLILVIILAIIDHGDRQEENKKNT